MLLPPGYTSFESMKRIGQAKLTAMQKPKTIDDMIEAGVIIIGSPATVREKLEEFQKLAGFGTVLVKTQFGTSPAQMTLQNMEALAKEVMPHFRAGTRAGAMAEPAVGQ
jgi:alkanesulfonate monooxygenase SsuD/methylene tetrahydromethanopterin reductase-like flavin-dependent oxidoreductase (luciferase family)